MSDNVLIIEMHTHDLGNGKIYTCYRASVWQGGMWHAGHGSSAENAVQDLEWQLMVVQDNS